MTCSVPDQGPEVDVRPVPAWAPRPAAPATFADLTTLRVGGAIGRYVEARSEAEFVDAVRATDASGTPLLVIGGGSNLLAADAPFDGVVVRDARQEITLESEDGCGGAAVRVSAGQAWDEFVCTAIRNGWMGVEALSGIPGTVGAAPIQNVGAYGQEVAGSIAAVRTWDRLRRAPRTFALADLAFGYRTSVLKRTLADADADAGGGRVWGPTGRYVVLSVTFQFRLATLGEPVRYAELARTLGVELGERAPAAAVRAAVLDLRRSKGMVLDEADRDTWSAGSFFTNPVLTDAQAAALPEDAPRFPVTDATRAHNIGQAPAPVPGLVKTSAAWLINRSGLDKGFAVGPDARLSTKHALALTNCAAASGADVRALKDAVQERVRRALGVNLEPEPVIL